MTGALNTEAPSAKHSRNSTAGSEKSDAPQAASSSTPPKSPPKKDDSKMSSDSEEDLPKKKRRLVYNCVPRPITAERRYNPVFGDVQRDICRDLGMNFIEANECVLGGTDVRLKPPTSIRSIGGDGNCLFRALSYAVTGSESQHHVVRRQIVRHLTTDRCWRLVENYLSTDNTIEEYVQRTYGKCGEHILRCWHFVTWPV